MFGLFHDPDEYRHLSIDELVAALNRSPKLIRSLRANAQPILMPADNAPESVKALEISPDERQRRVDVIRGDTAFQIRIGQAFALRFADQEPPPHVEKRIYDGFQTMLSRTRIQRIRRMA